MSQQSVLMALLLSLLTGSTKDPILARHTELLEEYDFIVVGSGPSGSTVASRLSEAENITVLLLEAGPSDLEHPATQLPPNTLALLNTAINWNFTTVEQKHALAGLEGRKLPWHRGRVLGGTASWNQMVYHRGSPHDFDSWEDHGAEGWSWQGVLPYYKKAERAMDEGLSKNLGRDGKIKLTSRPVMPLAKIITKAGQEAGLPYIDYHDDMMEGIGPVTQNNYEGLRQGPPTSYLRTVLPERKDRLHVVTNAHASRILFRKKRAVGLSFIDLAANHQVRTIRCRKEIVLSAGAAGTPHLLQLSGVGPRKVLLKNKIPVVANLPGVGSNLQEHTSGWLTYRVRDLKEDDVVTQQGIERGIDEFIEHGTGVTASALGLDTVVHSKTKYFNTSHSLSTSKRPFPNMQILFFMERMMTPYKTDSEDDKVSDMSAAVCLQHPKSRGSIRLRSRNPLEQPLINPNLFEHEDDVLVQIDGFKIMEKIESTSTLQNIGFRLIMPSVCNGSATTPRSDDFYRCFTKSLAYTECHPCCTAAMGKDDDVMAVLDSRLRVRGIEGVRAADASVFPHHVSGPLQAVCFMIGEKAAAMIKEDWGLGSQE